MASKVAVIGFTSFLVALVSFSLAGCPNNTTLPNELTDIIDDTSLTDDSNISDDWDGLEDDNVVTTVGIDKVKDASSVGNIEAYMTVSETIGLSPLAIAFDASSTIAKGQPITGYYWDFGDGAVAEGVAIEHEYPHSGTYTVSMTAENASGKTAVATVIINILPWFDIASTDIATEGDVVTFAAELADAASIVPDHVQYVWNFGDGNTATGSTVNHAFSKPGNYIVTLTLTLGLFSTDCASKKVSIEAKPIQPIVVADAGQDQSVDENTIVTLDGSASHVDADIALQYAWTQIDGPAVNLANPSSAITMFTAPDVSADTDLTFELQATADGISDTDTVIIHVAPIVIKDPVNIPPTADAGDNIIIYDTDGDGLESVTLDASSSTDSDGDITYYSWIDTNTATVLAEGTSPIQSVAGLVVGNYDVQLVVVDDNGASSIDTISIIVNNAGAMVVTATDGLSSIGNVGGPFSPSQKTYTIANNGNSALTWSATKTQDWLSLSSVGGELAAGASIDVIVELSSFANALPAGPYADYVAFENTTNGAGNTTRLVELQVNSPGELSVTDSTDLAASGTEGGSFSPTAKQYTLKNVGDNTLNWSADATEAWISVSPTNGSLATNASVTITVEFNAVTSTLLDGSYNAAVNFRNDTNDLGTTSRDVLLTVEPAVVISGPMNVAYADTPAMIDGVINTSEWASAQPYAFDATNTSVPGVVVQGTITTISDTSATAYLMHDANYIYIAVNVVDDSVVSAATNVWEADVVEVFLDHDNSNSTYLGLSRMQFDIAAGGQTLATGVVPADSWTGAASLTANGYSVEYRIAKADFNITTGTYGFDIAINDIEPTANNIETRYWHTATSDAVEHENLWGDIVLAEGPGQLSVSNTTFAAVGLEGGPFSPTSAVYTLTNIGGEAISWHAADDANWLNLSLANGTLQPGASINVTASLNSTTDTLGDGIYSSTISFVNDTNSNGNTSRFATLQVDPITPGFLTVTAGDFTSNGQVGGPFSPNSKAYTLTNTGGQSLDWTAAKSVNWLTLSGTTGTLAPGGSAMITVSINSNANSLSVGNYTDAIAFTNITNNAGNATRSAYLTVNQLGNDTMTTAHRTTGIAPLMVVFDAVDTTTPVPWSSSVAQPSDGDYAKYHYEWNFGDNPAATWSTDGASRNEAKGFVAAHMYEQPGTYTATLTITTDTGSVHTYTQTITVESFSGTTYYVSASGSDANNGLSPSTPFKSPATGLAMLGANKRVLFKRGDYWSITSQIRLNDAGPQIVGAYYNTDGSDDASQPKPIIQNVASGNVFEFTGTHYFDLRIMDLELQGTNKSGSSISAGGFDNKLRGVTLFRLMISNFGTSIVANYGRPEDDYTYYNEDIGVIDCVQRDNGGYAGFTGARRLVYLGCDFQRMGNHALRTWHSPKSVISHNILHGNSQGHALKLHNQQYLTNLPDTAYCVVSDNDFKTLFPMTVMIAPQNTESYEVVRNIVFERNLVRGNAQQQIALVVSGPDNIVRNNIFDLTGSVVYCRAVQIQVYDVAPPPTGFEMYNNTIYRHDDGLEFSALKLQNAPGLYPVFKNNLVSAPNYTGYTKTLVENDDGTVINENNLLTDNAGFVNAASGDFHLLSSSVAIGSGQWLPEVRDDYDDKTRTFGSAPDLGACQH